MRNRIPNKLGGAALVLAALVALQPAQAQAGQGQNFNVIYTFTGGADGARPLGNLLLNQGILYGTTSGGGAHNAGTVFQVDATTHVETVLHAFAGGRADGAAPFAGLIRDSAGNLYGATFGGGAHFVGTVFEMPVGGGFTLLHSFQGPLSEGECPAGTLVMDHAGNLFGTTYTGGNTTGWGTVFEIAAGNVYKTGQSFSPDGALPRAGLFLENGILYGTTYGGGARYYGGTVFQVGVTTALYTFTGGADGAQPTASLIGDSQGNLYGTASAGGSASLGNGNGVVFELNLSTGQETVLHTFTGPDGSTPTGALVRDSQGNLYGTTMLGGASGFGTVFKLDTSGILTTLHGFTGLADGGNPFAGLVLDTLGNLWGVTSAGGSAAAPGGNGTVFEIIPGAG
jgi:uncharacterized repeat protein (TIGR03803 family)